ncbi:ABC transporter permease subunit [Mycoplasmoides pneumoniae]|uniref:Amino acid or sugar ABC transporter, permease protein n=3 Tax=Mycoplasmoides pneumoniae TaxID=2104 RepID=A0AB33HLI2_MYCPM|nr:ABC transporter permease [Mycoplasmoides pneumoniae]ALA30141.1 hypothetical protein C897_01450 [Mycoplasmoides pneumoniae PI 1428]ALA31094.1 hypothetical protein B434_02940 [Mycoplasmoides pneumoniae 19294]ALA31538.1 hypothetical protein F536_01420 [Mycoplasmoides pneumoniae 39443]ALA32251.1 hypothetical protein F533_01450 [Mycoplasmoides pneumoniae 51494]ALA32952.1 hypothetical protein F530_01450 [Mycoplasmoides pneumoniae 54089]
MNALNYLKHRFLFSKDKFWYAPFKQKQRRSIYSTFSLIVLSFIVSFFLIVAIPGIKGGTFLEIFTRLFKDRVNIENFARQIAIYTLAALAFSFCMSVGVFNIGISGQMMAGANFGFMMILKVFPESFRPAFGGQIITILLMILGSVTVAMVVAALKVFFKVNEVVSAIMLNWVIVLVSAYLVGTYIKPEKTDTSQFYSIELPDAFALYNFSDVQQKYGWLTSLVIAIAAAIFIAVLMKFTVFGHKLKSTGLSVTGSQAAGYSVKKYQFLSFVISGILSGLLAAVVYTASFEKQLTFSDVGDFGITSVPITGFDGIAIGLIALNSPARIVIVSTIISFVTIGAKPAGLNAATASLVLGIMMYFAAIYNLMIYIKPWRMIVKLNIGKMNEAAYDEFQNEMAANLETLSFQRFLDKQKRKHDKERMVWFDTKRFEEYQKKKQATLQTFHENSSQNLLQYWKQQLLVADVKRLTFKWDFLTFKHQQKYILRWYKGKNKKQTALENEFASLNEAISQKLEEK